MRREGGAGSGSRSGTDGGGSVANVNNANISAAAGARPQPGLRLTTPPPPASSGSRPTSTGSAAGLVDPSQPRTPLSRLSGGNGRPRKSPRKLQRRGTKGKEVEGASEGVTPEDRRGSVVEGVAEEESGVEAGAGEEGDENAAERDNEGERENKRISVIYRGREDGEAKGASG